MIKLRTILTLLVMLVPAMPAIEANDNIHSLKTINARLPMYNKDRLQFFIYSRELLRQGNKIDARDAIIDIIRKGVNVDNVKYMDKVKLYPLGTPAAEVLDFWKDKQHSDGIIMSPAAQIDQNSKTASGMEKVYFRSPMMDLDGVGFVANYDKRNVLVRKDVRIVIRMEAVEAVQKKAGQAAAGSSAGDVDVTSDTMFIDFENNIITLEGDVKVNESRFNIDCNKLILYMKAGAVEGLSERDFLKGPAGKTEPRQAEPKKEAAKSKNDDNAQALSKIICIGKVVITRKLSKEDLDKGAQVAKAGKAIYDMNTQQIVLTEDKPSIARGKDTITGKTITLWRETERMQVDKDAVITMKIPKKEEEKAKADALKSTEIYSDFMDIDYPGNLAVFTGNVKINDTMMDVDCHKMTIYLEDRPDAAKKTKTAKPKSDQALTENVKASKDVSEIICVGDVVVSRKVAADNGETAYADKAIYNLKESKIILSGNNPNNPIIIRGKDSVSGQLVTIWVDQQRMKVDRNSRIVLESMKSGKMSESGQAPSKGAAVVTSDYSDINYGSNEMSFDGKVRVKDPQMDLVCQKMKIYLEEKPGTATKADKTGDPMEQLQGGEAQKDVSKIVCTGDVQAEDPKMTLNCDTLTILMADKKQLPTDRKKAKAEAVGPMGSDGKREISRMICDGHVKLESKEQKTDDKTKAAAVDPKEGVQDIIKKGPAGKTVVNTDLADIRPPENYAELVGKVVIDEPRVNLRCRKMQIYADELKPEGQMKLSGDIDDEEKVASDEVPRRISLGAGKELSKIICLDDVIIKRKGGEKDEKATGSHALYEVIDRKITLTGKPEKMPTLEQDSTVMEGDKFILYLNSEKVDAIGGKLKEGKMPKINNTPARPAK